MVRYHEVLGIASTNVPAYSNGNDDYFSGEANVLHGIFTGYKWQCVEFARRWLLLRKTCIFRSIPSASDMWTELTHLERVTDGEQIPLIAHPNRSPTMPTRDSILIYPRSHHLPFGHVAIITDVGPNYIRVAEQNYRFHRWSGDYARQIPIEYRNGQYFLHDTYKISGWLEIAGNEQLKPLDTDAVQVLRSRQR
jgi:trypanothione synthetase/amidase